MTGECWNVDPDDAIDGEDLEAAVAEAKPNPDPFERAWWELGEAYRILKNEGPMEWDDLTEQLHYHWCGNEVYDQPLYMDWKTPNSHGGETLAELPGISLPDEDVPAVRYVENEADRVEDDQRR